MKKRDLADYTVVVANTQTQGRGQRGSLWASEPGKNLTFSVLKSQLSLPVAQVFDLNVWSSVAVLMTLEKYGLPHLSVKWPNDILSGSRKICGMLIENSFQGDSVGTAVIGIGLNVNQEKFENLPQASSLKQIMGKGFDLDAVLKDIVLEMERSFFKVHSSTSDALWKKYDKALFRKGMPSTFTLPDGLEFEGIIRSVLRDGKLAVDVGKADRNFGFKEVQLKY